MKFSRDTKTEILRLDRSDRCVNDDTREERNIYSKNIQGNEHRTK